MIQSFFSSPSHHLSSMLFPWQNLSLVCVLLKRQRLKMLNRVREDWGKWDGEREIKVLHVYAEIGKKMTTIYTVGVYFTTILFISQPALPKLIDSLLYNGTEPGEFPFPVYYPHLDQQKYYFYIIAYTYVGTSMVLTITVANDTMFILHVQHVCGVFAAIGQKLKRVGEEEVSTEGRDIDFENLAICIDRHNDAIKFAKLIENLYSPAFFFVVGLNMICMSVTGLQILTRSSNPEETVRFVAFVGAQMFHLYIESYISQILMDHSLSIRDHIHSCKWYNISLKAQKLLGTMSMRCNTPCKLTAGKICTMSIETFGVVVKTSVSYFTLFRSMQ
ncbi:odorant receptor 13a-like [Venturia canescens]|uniref:odorant receptor 13a-like n=1 Tax=Venturia canescens TaxID=32260 RepID=UPI001C9D0D88|nr:odorant receptor 13a-like [Venturia canescens]